MASSEGTDLELPTEWVTETVRADETIPNDEGPH